LTMVREVTLSALANAETIMRQSGLLLRAMS